jgi:proteasome accessory factor C
MSDTAAAQLRRILALVPELADDEEHPIDALAVALGTDRATLLDDLVSLTERYDPGGFVDEGVSLFVEGDRVQLTSQHFRRPMRLTGAELHALELGLAVLECERPPEERLAIGRARVRLREVIARLPNEPQEIELRAAATASGDPERLRVLREAVRARRKVRLRYRRGDRDVATERIVAPYALVASSGMWYTVAWCDDSTGVRVFRLDRMESAEATPDTFEAPRSSQIDSIVRNGRVLLHADAPQAMTVRYSPRIARWIAEREGRELDADGSLTMEHPLLDVAWGVRHALQYGPDAEVLSPPLVRQELARRLDAVVAGLGA